MKLFHLYIHITRLGPGLADPGDAKLKQLGESREHDRQEHLLGHDFPARRRRKSHSTVQHRRKVSGRRGDLYTT
jgi:hypothetical protein